MIDLYRFFEDMELVFLAPANDADFLPAPIRSSEEYLGYV